jgi:hypothetical protein
MHAMHLFIIRPNVKTIEAFEFSAGIAQIKQIIGFDSIAFDEIDDQGNVFYFDEDCFIRGDKTAGRFQIGGLAPVAGIGVVISHSEEADHGFSQPTFTLDVLQAMVKYL